MVRSGKTVKRNYGLGRDFYFFGKFRSKILAARSEREHPGSFIIARKGYYYVLKDKTRRNPEWKAPLTKRKKKRLGVLYQKAFAKFSRENPRRVVLVYGRVLKIFARKTAGPYKGQDFVHPFERGAIMIGLRKGQTWTAKENDLIITHP